MDKYKVCVDELIGKGSFGEVYIGYNKQRPGLKLALKLVPKDVQSDADIKALRRECEIQKGVQHENIVRAIEAFETVQKLVLVTEYVDGGNLAMLMSQHPKGLRNERVKSLVIDLMCALHYLHGHRILHRDLKPQNVLIEKASGKAKLTDFGFARNLSMNTLVLTSIKGTPLYMAPELIEEKPYDFKADLWSAGSILYEAAFGTPPFATNNLFELIKKIRYESISWPLQRPCSAFLQGLLEKNPKRRMNWDDILQQDYICQDPRIQQCQKAALEFTKNLTESQELAKEIQRQDKAKKLSGGSQTLINIAQRHEEKKKTMEQVQAYANNSHLNRRYSDFPAMYQATIVKPEPIRRNSDIGFQATPLREDEDVSFNNEEWLQFLESQLNSADDICQVNANDLAMLLKPLHSSKASPEVMIKTATVLAMPFMKAAKVDSREISKAYKRAKVCESLVNCLTYVDLSQVECIRTLLMLLARLCYTKEQQFAVNIDANIMLSLLTIEDVSIQSYCLDVLIQMAVQDLNSVCLIKTDILFKCMKMHPKKVIMFLTLVPSKRQPLQTWLKNNKLPNNCDQLSKLCDKVLSL